MILIVDNRSHFLRDLRVRLEELGVAYDVIGSEQQVSGKRLDRYQGVILTGGPLLLDRKIYLGEVALDLTVLLDAKVPILGICLGMQLMAETHNSGLHRLPDFAEGNVEVSILCRDRLFAGLPDTIEVREAHFECIANLPDVFEHLATSASCKYEAIKHRGREQYGVQFHPEVSGAAGKRTLLNFATICSEVHHGFKK